MSTDLFGNPIPPAPITGAQGYLLDTRRTDAPIAESGKLAALRAASAKDAPALLDWIWIVGVKGMRAVAYRVINTPEEIEETETDIARWAETIGTIKAACDRPMVREVVTGWTSSRVSLEFA